MSQEIDEAFVLQVIPHKERSAILHLFTKTQGLLHVFCSFSKKKPCPSPPVLLECSYESKNDQMHKLTEWEVVQYFFQMRTSLNKLQALSHIIKALNQSQVIQNPAPKIFSLLKRTIPILSQSEDPKPITCLTFLKILKHEGIMAPSTHCQRCKTVLTDGCFWEKGEFLCEKHSLYKQTHISQNEQHVILQMLTTKNTDDLKNILVTEELEEKIRMQMKECFE